MHYNNFVVRCDIEQKLPRKLNNIKIEYKFMIYKTKKDGYLQEDKELIANNEEDDDLEPLNKKSTAGQDDDLESSNKRNTAGQDNNLESPNKKGLAGQFIAKVGKVFTGGITVGKTIGKTIGKVFSKTDHHHLEFVDNNYKICVSNKGIDEKGSPKRSLSKTRLIRHVDVDKCGSVSISITPQNCHLVKVYLFVRYV